jgi:hypothetical protein
MARKKSFERRIIRTRNRLEKRGQKMAFNAIKKQYKAVFDLVGVYLPQFLLDNLNVSTDPIQNFMNEYYPLFSNIGLMYRDEAFNQKDAESDFYESVFMEKLRHFALVETGARVTSITETTEKFIRGAIESAMQVGVEEGLGVDAVSRLIRKNLTDSLGDIGVSRAKMIAQTEMITGSNQASQEGIESTGLEYKKFWSTSGLKNIRDSHIFAEENHPKGIGKNDVFDMGNGNTMRFVGDPQGQPEEVINCRCTTLYEVI